MTAITVVDVGAICKTHVTEATLVAHTYTANFNEGFTDHYAVFQATSGTAFAPGLLRITANVTTTTAESEFGTYCKMRLYDPELVDGAYIPALATGDDECSAFLYGCLIDATGNYVFTSDTITNWTSGGYFALRITSTAADTFDQFLTFSVTAEWLPGGVFTADFSGTPLSGPAPLTVAFTDATSDTPTTWAWDFGDGNFSSDQNPTNVYTTPGTYTVALTSGNGTDSDTETKAAYITVLGTPVVDFVGVPTSGTVALSVAFTDLSTNSPDSWRWDFGDGESDTVQNPTHVYNFVGVYTVTLRASNSAGVGVARKVDYITVLALTEYGPATIENCDVDTGGAAVGLRVADVAIARDNIFGSVVIDASAELRVKDNAYSTLTNNGTLTSLAGDRSVWDTTNFAASHARDIDEATGVYHLINAATQAYTISNPSTDRAYDVTATTLNELAAVVGTLIADLQAKGLIS